MEKKKVIIVILIILAIAIIGSIVYISITGEEVNLSLSEEVTLNAEEQEILDITRKIDEKLKNPVIEDEETNQLDFSINNTEPTTFKDVFNNIYEVRKYTTEEGKTSYVFQIGLKSDKQLENDKRFVIYNEEGIYFYPELEDLEFDETTDETKNESNTTVYFGNEFYKALFKSLDKEINEIWQNSLTYNNIDYNKIYNMI
jgi:type II secretory pathway component GspD/PulD (secretin)